MPKLNYVLHDDEGDGVSVIVWTSMTQQPQTCPTCETPVRWEQCGTYRIYEGNCSPTCRFMHVHVQPKVMKKHERH